MGKWPEIIQNLNVNGLTPLTKKSSTSTVSYTKYDKNIDGEGYPIEHFSVYDSTLYPDRDLPRYEGGYSAEITILLDADNGIYPQVSILDGNESFSVYDGKTRLGTSGLDLYTVEMLNKKQLKRYKTVVKLLKDALAEFIKLDNTNITFSKCLNFNFRQNINNNTVGC